MSALSFRHRAIAHLRDRLDVHTIVLPQSRIEDEHGNARFEGYLLRARTSSTLNLASLYALTVAAILALVGERPMSAAAHEACRGSALGLVVVAIVLFVAAMWSRHRNRSPVVIELRGDTKVDVSVVEALRSASGDRSAWLVAAQGFASDALAAAERLHVRCFTDEGKTIAECISPESTAAAKAA